MNNQHPTPTPSLADTLATLAKTCERLNPLYAAPESVSLTLHESAAALRTAASEVRRLAAVEMAAQRAERWFSAVIAAQPAELAIGVRDTLRAALGTAAQPTAEGR